MWCLKNENKGTIYYITPCQDPYIVGRSSGEIIISGDASISRTHAHLKINNRNKLEVTDCGSKYGTYINDSITKLEPIKPKTSIILESNDKIMFGRLSSVWLVVNESIKTVVSTLSENTRVELTKMLKQFEGCCVNEFSDECTHLTMPLLSITMKVLLSLSAGIPIVTPEYWKEFLKCIQTKQKLINYKNYLPPLNESFLRMSEINLDINLKRKVIFSGKRFVFMMSKHMAKYELVIRMAGGTCTHLGQKLTKSELIKSDTIVIQYVVTGLTQTEHSQSLSDCEKVIKILKQNGKRAIPDVEIGLAIIYCSIEKYCNPEIKMISTEHVATTTVNLQTSTLLAVDTPSEPQSTNSKQYTTSCEIPDSELVKKTCKPSEMLIDDSSSDEMLSKLNVLDIESETTQKFIVPETIINKSAKRKNDSTETSQNKKINLEDDIESTPSQYEPLESFLTKKQTTTTAPPPKPIVKTSAKRNLSSRNNSSAEIENNDDDLFSFKNPSKKPKQTEVTKDNPFLDIEFNFKRKTHPNRASTSQSSLGTFLTQNTPDDTQNDRVDGQRNNKIQSNDTQGMPIDVSDYIKPVDLSAGKWLSRELVKSMNIKSNADDTVKDMKPNETDLWIESMKGCVKVVNTAVVLDNSDNVYYHRNSKDSLANSNNKKNFKAFKKIINYKKLNPIIICKPIIID